MKDQYGRDVAVGDTVTITGKITNILDDPNYLNCTIQLDQPLPPSGAQSTIQANTQQVVRQPLEQQQSTSGAVPGHKVHTGKEG